MDNTFVRSSNYVSISIFYEDFILKKYNMSPVYQRNSVWGEEKKSFFIDSILKNLPIPPIYLRQKLDSSLGKTTYEVIDGKQRLESIIQFITGEIPASSETEDPFYDEELDGKYFADLESKDLSHYKKQFWRYQIPIEYIDTEEKLLIENIFDRLNRNGEPLTGQELRNSTYHSSTLIKLSVEFSESVFWKERLTTTDKKRMEDIEFISELILFLLTKKEQTASQAYLDEAYYKFANNTEVNWDEITAQFNSATTFLGNLDVKYIDMKVFGVSHLYGLWGFSVYCLNNSVSCDSVKGKLEKLFIGLRSNNAGDENVKNYKHSMSHRTKSEGQRRKRKEALINFCLPTASIVQ